MSRGAAFAAATNGGSEPHHGGPFRSQQLLRRSGQCRQEGSRSPGTVSPLSVTTPLLVREGGSGVPWGEGRVSRPPPSRNGIPAVSARGGPSTTRDHGHPDLSALPPFMGLPTVSPGAGFVAGSDCVHLGCVGEKVRDGRSRPPGADDRGAGAADSFLVFATSRALSMADARPKARLYEELGVEVTYDPDRRVVGLSAGPCVTERVGGASLTITPPTWEVRPAA